MSPDKVQHQDFPIKNYLKIILLFIAREHPIPTKIKSSLLINLKNMQSKVNVRIASTSPPNLPITSHQLSEKPIPVLQVSTTAQTHKNPII
jgi:hypothetical protein